MKRVTAKDVAALASVDRSTVSRVLNSPAAAAKYSPETIARVRKAAEKLAYRPSMAARALRTGKAMLVGVVVPEISSPFFAELASYVEHLAWEQGYRVVVCSTREDPERQEAHIADLVARGVDGLIVSPCSDAAIAAVPAAVAVDRPAPEAHVPFVGLDNHEAGRLLGGHLTEPGYRSIGVVVPDCDADPTLRHRFEGLSSALGGDCAIAWSVEAAATTELAQHVHLQTAEMLHRRPRPEAIIGLTSSCTLGALGAMAELDIAWGDDIGLAGVDDFAGADLMKPAITVVAQPIREIAASAFEILMQRMNPSDDSPTGDAEQRLLKSVLLIRDSLPARQGREPTDGDGRRGPASDERDAV